LSKEDNELLKNLNSGIHFVKGTSNELKQIEDNEKIRQNLRDDLCENIQEAYVDLDVMTPKDIASFDSAVG